MVAEGTVAVKWRDTTSPADLSGPMPLVANSGVAIDGDMDSGY
jgi:hypothetical protein